MKSQLELMKRGWQDGEHAQRVRELGMEIVRKTGELGGLYLNLCKYIRANQVSPHTARYELFALGFPKTRVSEIIRVAYCNQKVWRDYEARLMGFNQTLRFARDNDGQLIGEPVREAMGMSQAEGEKDLKAREHCKAIFAPTASDRTLNQYAERFLKKAGKMYRRLKKVKVWKLGGFELVLRPISVTAPVTLNERSLSPALPGEPREGT